MHANQLKPDVVVTGPILPEPVQIIVAVPLGDSIKLVGKGLQTGQVHEPILDAEQLAALTATEETEPFDGDPERFRLGIEAMRLALAYEYDPYFSLSIARVDPLPHQLEAVYDCFLGLPRIRFLLADDPGAGKTIMAGLLIKDRIVKEVDTDRLRRITDSTLEGLAKRDLNLSAIVGKSEEAKERRLVPEVIEGFFVDAAPLAGITPRPDRSHEHVYRVGRLPRAVLPYGDRLEPQFGKLGREYRQIVFDKELLNQDATLEWVTPGHPLFECVRELVQDRVQGDLQRGTVFYDLHRTEAARLDVFSAEIRDGLGHVLQKRLFITHTSRDGQIDVRQPTIFLDLALAPKGTDVPDRSAGSDRSVGLDRAAAEAVLRRDALVPLLDEARRQREREVRTISEHMELSLNTIIDRAQVQFAELLNQKESGSEETGLDGRIRILEDKLDELNTRLERRRAELEKEQQCTISNLQHLGAASVLPHPERDTPVGRQMVRDPEIERIAVEAVCKHEEARGWRVQSVEQENRGFDLISRRPHPEDPDTAIEVRFIEVKGRAHIGEVALTTNEYKTAQRLKKDFWLYVVFNCAEEPEVHPVQDPVRLGWKPVVTVEHYHVGASEILKSQPVPS